MAKANAVEQKVAKDTKEIREMSNLRLHAFVRLAKIQVYAACRKVPDPEKLGANRDFDHQLHELLVCMDDLRHGEEEQQRRWYGKAGAP